MRRDVTFRGPVRHAISGFVFLLLALALSACGGGGGGAAPLGTTPRYTFVANAGSATVSTYVVDSSTGRMKWIGKTSTGLDPKSITVDPSQKHVYVANNGSNTVSEYTVNGDGSLTLLGNVGAGTNPDFMTIDPSGKHAYVANSGSNDISAYTIGSDGTLTQIDCGSISGATCGTGVTADFAAGTSPTSVAVDPSGTYAYVTNAGSNDISAYTLGGDGSLSLIDCSTIAGASCGTTFTADFATGTGPQDIAIEPTGTYAYVANNGSNQIIGYSIGSDGSLTQVVSNTQGYGAYAIAIDPTGKYLFLTNAGSGDMAAYSIGSDGLLTMHVCTAILGKGCGALDIFDYVTGSLPESATVDPSGNYLYVGNSGDGTVSEYAINSSAALAGIPVAVATGPALSGPASLAVSRGTAVQPASQYAYVPNSYNNTVSEYTIGSNGALNAMTGTATTGTFPDSITADPTGRYVYVPNQYSADVSAYTVGSDGSLTQIPCSSSLGTECEAGDTDNFAAGTYPGTISVDPTGRYAYVTNYGDDTVSMYTIGTDGSLSPLIPGGGTVNTVSTGSNPVRLIVDPSGRYVYFIDDLDAKVSMYTIGSDGSLSPLIPSGGTTNTVATGNAPYAITVDPSDQYAYVTNTSGETVSMYTIGSDGSLSPLIPSGGTTNTVATGTGTSPDPIIVDPTGRYVFVGNYGSGTVGSYTVGSDGSLTAGSSTGSGASPVSFAFDPTGQYFYAVDQSDGTVSQYTFGSDGSLTAMSTATVATGQQPLGICTTASWK